MAKSWTAEFQKELSSYRLPTLANCLPAGDAKPYGITLPKRNTARVIRPNYPSSASTKEECRTRKGVKSFFNVMWDPRVMRGPGFKTFQQDSKEQCEAIRISKSQPKSKDKFKIQQRKLGGICPWPPELPRKELDLKSLKWDQFLADAIAEIKLREVTTQTSVDAECGVPCLKPSFSNGIHVSTQIEEFDLFNKEEMMGLISETLVEKISAQAIVEVMEEEEIAALTKFENGLRESKLENRARLVDIREREQLELFEARKIGDEVQAEAKREREIQSLVLRNCFSRATVGTIKERLLARLKKMGYLIDCVQLDIERRFIPWLNHMVLGEIEHRRIYKEILDDILVFDMKKRVQDILDPLMETLLSVDYLHKRPWQEEDDIESVGEFDFY